MPGSRIIDLSKVTSFTAVNLLLDGGAIPGPVVIPFAAQISLVWNLTDGKQAHVVTYGRYSGSFSGTVTQANALLSGLLSAGGMYATLAAFMPTTGSLAFVTIRDVNSANQPLITSTGTAGPGTSASPALPDETAAVITLRTALVGRGNRGRMYIPNFATNALAAGGVIAPAVVTALNNWAGQFAGVYSGQGYTWALGQKHRQAYTSPITGRAFPERPAAAPTITNSVVRDNHWDSQRRRGLK